MTFKEPKVFIKNNILSIVFSNPMLLDGPYSILTSSNYNFFNGITTSSFEDYTQNIFSYSKFHVSYTLKEAFAYFDYTICKLQFFMLETSTYVGVTTLESKATSKRLELKLLPYLSNLSLSDYKASSTGINTILLTLPNDIYLSNIDANDFFIVKNGYSYPITSINTLSLNEFIFTLDTKLFFSATDIISLHSSQNINSTDIFGELLYKNEQTYLFNLQENELTNVSITSYKNNFLELNAKSKVKMLRYDGSDFELVINNTAYPLEGHSPYTPSSMSLKAFIPNVNFSNHSEIFLKGRKNLLNYSSDTRLIPFTNEAYVTVDSFYPIKGDIYYSIDSLLRDFIRISIEFNKTISRETTQNYYLGSLKYDITLKCLKINFDNFATLNIFGEGLESLAKDYSYTALVYIFDNILEIFFSISDYNFLLTNLGKISYFSFEINSDFISSDNTSLLSSYDCSLNQVISSYLTCRKEDVNGSWTLLNKETTSNIILVLDTQKDLLLYGNEKGTTSIIGDVYFIASSDNYAFSQITLRLTNLNITGDLYILTNDVFDYNFENCSFNNLFIYA